jgi:hypothetical protein
MSTNNKSDLLDTTDAKTLSETDKEVLKSAPHSGNSPNPLGIAGIVMSDESYVNRDENSEFNSDMPTDSGVINQTIKSDEIDASTSSD